MADPKDRSTAKFSFSGHQAFVFRHGWIHKGVWAARLLLAGEVGG